MKKQLSFPVLIFLCLSMFSCTQSSEELKTAERIMDTSSDSALHILQHINPKLLYTPSTKALYSLLMSQALDKNQIKVKSDSLITIATGYYTKNESVRAGYSWFYYSRTAENRGNAELHALNLIKAQEFAVGTGNDKLLGLVYGDKAIMYKSQNQTDSSIYYFKLANKSFTKTKNYRNIIIDLLNIGEEYLKTSQYNSANQQFLLAENLLKNRNDTLLNSTLYRCFGTVFFRQNKLDSAIMYYRKAPLTNISVYNSNKWLMMTNVFLQRNNLDSARLYLNKVEVLQDMAPDYYGFWQTIYEKEKNYSKALYYSKKVKAATDSLYKQSLVTSFAGMESKYKFQSLEISNQNLTIKNKQKGMLLLIALLIISGLVIIVLFRSIWTNKKQLETQKQLIVQEKILLEKEKEKVEIEQEKSVLLQNQLKMHELLLKYVEQYRNESVKRPGSTLSRSNPKQNSVFYQELIACMNVQYHDISNRLHNQYPLLTKQDILICCLLLANFETGNIATILDIDNNSIIKQRYRVRTKLGLLKSDHLIDFLRHF